LHEVRLQRFQTVEARAQAPQRFVIGMGEGTGQKKENTEKNTRHERLSQEG
jgi:hypothetical protein